MNFRRIGMFGLLALGFLTCAAFPLAAQYRMSKIGDTSLPANVRPPQLEGVGVEEHLGASIDMNLMFTDESGYPVRLGKYFNQGRPVILDLVYYNCPMLCTLILNGQTEAMRNIPWTPGKEYDVVTISIDPRESFDVAQKKKSIYMGSFDRPAPGWHFLTDRDGNVQRLAKQIGFNYRYDPRIEQYAHAAAIMVLTPQGRMARYLYGIRFSPRDLRFALAEASEGRSTLAVEKILLFCYHYDPKAGAYVWFALNVMRLGGALTVLIFAFFGWRMFRVERRRTSARFKEGLA
ncbi:MAG: SCO family protein [Acidobacteriota bacterium]